MVSCYSGGRLPVEETQGTEAVLAAAKPCRALSFQRAGQGPTLLLTLPQPQASPSCFQGPKYYRKHLPNVGCHQGKSISGMLPLPCISQEGGRPNLWRKYFDLFA